MSRSWDRCLKSMNVILKWVIKNENGSQILSFVGNPFLLKHIHENIICR